MKHLPASELLRQLGLDQLGGFQPIIGSPHNFMTAGLKQLLQDFQLPQAVQGPQFSFVFELIFPVRYMVLKQSFRSLNTVFHCTNLMNAMLGEL
jgi:hypothetical protein